MGINHIGHFLLTRELIDIISEGGRIVNLSSLYHKHAPKDFLDDLLGEKFFSASRQYAVSKLCNILFSLQLQKNFDKDGRKIFVGSVHPGKKKKKKNFNYKKK